MVSTSEWSALSFDPLAYVVDAEPALFVGELVSATVAWGWIAALATAAVGLSIGIRAMVRRAGGKHEGCPCVMSETSIST